MHRGRRRGQPDARRLLQCSLSAGHLIACSAAAQRRSNRRQSPTNMLRCIQHFASYATCGTAVPVARLVPSSAFCLFSAVSAVSASALKSTLGPTPSVEKRACLLLHKFQPRLRDHERTAFASYTLAVGIA